MTLPAYKIGDRVVHRDHSISYGVGTVQNFWVAEDWHYLVWFPLAACEDLCHEAELAAVPAPPYTPLPPDRADPTFFEPKVAAFWRAHGV